MKMEKRISDSNIKRCDKDSNTSQTNQLKTGKSWESEELINRMEQIKAINDMEKNLFQHIISKHQHLTQENVDLRRKMNQICSENVRLRELSDNQDTLGEVISVQCETESFYERLTETAYKRAEMSQNNVTFLDENSKLQKKNKLLKERKEKMKVELDKKVEVLDTLKSDVNLKMKNYETNIQKLYKQLESLIDQNKNAVHQFDSILNYQTRLDLTLEKEKRERGEIEEKKEGDKREMEKMYKIHCKEKEQQENTIRDLQSQIAKEQSKIQQMETDVKCVRAEKAKLVSSYNQLIEEELEKHSALWETIGCSRS